MILKIKRTIVINSLTELETHFNGKKWLDDNVHTFEDESASIDELVTEFFSDYPGHISITKANNKYVVTEYDITHAVIDKQRIMLCNTDDKAKELFCKIAIKRLKDNALFQQYPKKNINFEVLLAITKNTNTPLQIIGTK